MEIKKTEEDKYTVCTACWMRNLILGWHQHLKKEFITLNTNGIENIILNLEKVKYVDSSGLSATPYCEPPLCSGRWNVGHLLSESSC